MYNYFLHKREMMMAVTLSHFFFHTNPDRMCRLVTLQHIQKRLVLQLTFHTEPFSSMSANAYPAVKMYINVHIPR